MFGMFKNTMHQKRYLVFLWLLKQPPTVLMIDILYTGMWDPTTNFALMLINHTQRYINKPYLSKIFVFRLLRINEQLNG